MSADVVLVGGGLANALIAFRLTEARPELEVLLLERNGSVGGNHVWSFHGSDLTARQQAWMAPVIGGSWPQQEVHFPAFRRTLQNSYHSVTSGQLDRELRSRLGDRLHLGTAVTEVTPHRVRTADGRTFRGRAVIDGRGLATSPALTVAYQKFLGLHLEIEEPVDLAGPILMDATVEQLDGYRFVYTLPFGARKLLIEDTYYSDTPDLDREELRRRISAYAAARGWRIRAVAGEEEGVLPIVLTGDFDAFWAARPVGVPCSGMRAALFHQTTGYSLPEAVRLADELAQTDDLESAALDRRVRQLSRQVWRRGGYFRLLNRMLFLAAEPHLRYRVLGRFYTLPAALIERFYAGRPSLFDRARILIGKPPVPLARAVACLLPDTARNAHPTH